MATKTEVCTTHGHSFVESSIGKGGKPLQKSHIFCQKCGEVMVIEAEQKAA